MITRGVYLREIEMIHYKRINTFNSLLIFALLFFVCMPALPSENSSNLYDEKRLPYRLEEEAHYLCNLTCRFVVSDIDEDSRDEFVIYTDNCGGVKDKYGIIFINEEMKSEWEYHSNGPITYVICADIDFTGAQEIIYTERIENGFILNVINNVTDTEKLVLQYSFRAIEGIDTDGNGKWDGNIWLMHCIDINIDGTKDLIGVVNTGYDKDLRGIYAFDLKHQQRIWDYQLGSRIDGLEFHDMNGDKIPEIIVSTNAPCNGNYVNGTSDSLSYIIILDINGNLLFRRQMGRAHSRTHTRAADLNGDGTVELVSITSSSLAKFDHPNTITIWQWEDMTKIKEKTIYADLVSLYVEDITDDGQSEILIGTIDRGLKVYTHLLEDVGHIDYPGEGYILEIDDLAVDGNKEIVIRNDRGTVFFFNNRLQLLAKNENVRDFSILRREYGKPKKILLQIDAFYRLFTFEKVLLPPLPWGYILLSFFGGIFLCIVGFIVVKKLKPPPFITRLKVDLLDDIAIGIISLDKDNRLSFLNVQAENILGLKGRKAEGQTYRAVLKNDDQKELREFIDKSNRSLTESKKKEIRLRLGTEGREVLAEVLPLLDTKNRDLGRLIIVEDITQWSQSKRAMAWISMARLLAHEMKNPLANIMITLQCLQREYQKDEVSRAEAYDELVTSSIDEIMRLRNVANAFMRFAKLEKPSLRPNDINTIINETLEDYSHRISGAVHVKKVLSNNLPPVRLDENQIREMLTNLIENAINAMSEGGTLTVSTTLVQKFPDERNKIGSDFVAIEIADTGVGMSDEDVQKVFDPYFSKSEGGVGLGMVIVRRIIEDHNGTITINSRERIGTTITVELPV